MQLEGEVNKARDEIIRRKRRQILQPDKQYPGQVILLQDSCDNDNRFKSVLSNLDYPQFYLRKIGNDESYGSDLDSFLSGTNEKL